MLAVLGGTEIENALGARISSTKNRRRSYVDKRHSFKFLDDDLNRDLLTLLKKAKIAHSVDEDGLVHYFEGDTQDVENDLICSLRDKVFPSWALQTCPSEWIESYKDYMRRHDVPFKEELSDGELWFLIPRRFRPHTWKLDPPASNGDEAGQV